MSAAIGKYPSEVIISGRISRKQINTRDNFTPNELEQLRERWQMHMLPAMAKSKYTQTVA
jgi:hypothetical protein